MQVLGVTNYSHWRDTDLLRSCAAESQQTQKALRKMALQRLDSFAHVGVMEDLENSILSLASLTGLKMRGPAWKVHSNCHFSTLLTFLKGCETCKCRILFCSLPVKLLCIRILKASV